MRVVFETMRALAECINRLPTRAKDILFRFNGNQCQVTSRWASINRVLQTSPVCVICIESSDLLLFDSVDEYFRMFADIFTCIGPPALIGRIIDDHMLIFEYAKDSLRYFVHQRTNGAFLMWLVTMSKPSSSSRSLLFSSSS
jgi:hypothetical protein